MQTAKVKIKKSYKLEELIATGENSAENRSSSLHILSKTNRVYATIIFNPKSIHKRN